MLYVVLYALLLIWLSWEDIKHLRISISTLILLSLLGVVANVNDPATDLENSLIGAGCMFMGLSSLNHIFQNFTTMGAIGSGDIWLMAILAFSVPLEQFPIFIFLTGLSACIWGLVWRKWKGTLRFPMVPAISISFLVIRMFC